MTFKYGWGQCSHCGADVGATKNGLAVRHGFTRIKKGYKRVAQPHLRSGIDHKPCPGSGKPMVWWFRRE